MGAFIYACGEICDLQTWHSVCGRSDGGAGRHWLLRGERAAAALPGDAGKQYLGRFRQYYVLDVLRVLNKQAGVYDLLSEAFVEVKGQDRYFDRAVRRLQQQLRKPAEELGREITHQLFLLGCGAQMLKYASPPMAQTWCKVMLDTRGGVRLSEQIQNDLLLRATGGVCL